jgi:hypothetical protein
MRFRDTSRENGLKLLCNVGGRTAHSGSLFLHVILVASNGVSVTC